MINKVKSMRGQTLIEALTALGIIAVVITAISVAVTTALSNAEYNQSETLATKYAQQGSEIVTQIRDNSYNNFKNNYGGIYCLGPIPANGQQATLGSVQPSGCTSPNLSTFIRSVQIIQGGQPGACAANVAHVTVTVSFTDGKCQTGAYCHQVIDDSCLSTSNPIQAP